MEAQRLEAIKREQTEFYRSGATRTLEFRKTQLKKLKKAVKEKEADIIEALKKDFNKPEWETWTSEIGLIYVEIDHFLKHLKKWMRPKRVGSPLTLFPTTSKIFREPMGRSLIIAPWNYPFQLAIEPLIASIAAGNTVLLKPSEMTPATAKVIEEIITEIYASKYIAVLQGDGAEVVPQAFENYEPQHVFFTGSPAVGSSIAGQAAKKLIPCVLELGGKSPAIIDGSANMKVTARRILFGKMLNAGQTCVAPDYLLVHESAVEELIRTLKLEVERSYGKDPLQSDDIATMIHKRAFDRITGYLKDGEIVAGGRIDEERLKIEPTLILDPSMDSPVMKEEIFGPILPIITYKDEAEMISIVQENPDPLSLYIFSNKKGFQRRIIRDISFGGGAVNNAVVHFVNPELPFGGVRNSGTGSYHGKSGFDAFTHEKGMAFSGTWIDPKMKYAPYSKRSLNLIKKIFGW